MIRIIHFHRKTPLKFQSLYAYFEDIRRHLPAEMIVQIMECPFESRNLANCFSNLKYARCGRGRINHITGDVHYLTAALPSSSTILTIHDCGFTRHPSILKRQILHLFWLRLPVIKARFVTAVSHATKDDIIRLTGCNPEKIQVVYTTVKSHFHYVPKDFDSIKPRFLHIGTAPNKNGIRIIEAIAGIPCQLVIVGNIDQSYRVALDKWKIDYVCMTGLSDEEMKNCYSNCDLVVFPSTLEGFGMPIIEANMAGRPVLTSNTTSMPEVAGNAALLVNPFDVASIRNGVKRLINDRNLRNLLVELGFENVKRFDVASVALQYARLYQQVAQQKA